MAGSALRPSCHFLRKKKRDHILPQQYMISLNDWSLRRPPTSAPSTSWSSAASFPVASRLSCTGALSAFTPFAEGVGLTRCQSTEVWITQTAPISRSDFAGQMVPDPLANQTRAGRAALRLLNCCTQRLAFQLFRVILVDRGFLSAFAYVCPWIPQTLLGLRDTPKQTRHTVSSSWRRSSRRHTNNAQRHTHKPLRGLCLIENHPRAYTSRKPLR